MSNELIEKIFSVPIYTCVIDNLDEVTQEIDGCIDKMKFSMREEWGSTHFLSDINFDEDVIRKYRIK